MESQSNKITNFFTFGWNLCEEMILIGKMQLKKLLKRILKKFGLVVILIWHQILAIVNNLQVNV